MPITVGAQLDITPAAIDLDDTGLQKVAYFTDNDPAAVSEDFTATLALGSQTAAADVVPSECGGFDVYSQASVLGSASGSAITLSIANSTDGAAGSTNITAVSLDSGSEVTLGELPTNSIVTLTNGSVWNLQGASVTVGSLNLIDGSIINGTITAGAFNLQNGSISANLAGSNGLTVSGGGDVALTGDNSGLTGGVTIDADSTLAVNSDLALGSEDGAVRFSGGGTLQALGDMTLSATRQITMSDDAPATIDTNGYYVALPGGISGSGGLIVADSSGSDDGALDMSGSTNPGLLGNLTITGGFVAASDAADLGNADAALIFNGGGLRAVGGLNIPSTKVIYVEAGGATFDSNGSTVEIGAVLGGSSAGAAAGGITVMDTSATGGGIVLLKGGNLFQGGTTIVSGTLSINGDAALGAIPASPATNITFVGNGTLKWAGTADFALNANRSIVINSGCTATFDSNGFNATIPSAISGPGSLTATDSSGEGGTLKLSGVNSFTGVTLVGGSTETLILGNSAALAGSTYDTSGPGSLSLGGLSNATFGGLQGSGDFSLPDGFALSVGGNSFATTLTGLLTGNWSLTMDGTGQLILAGDNGGFSGTVTVANGGTVEAESPATMPSNVSVLNGGTLAVDLDGGAWTQSAINGLFATVDFESGSNLGLDTGYGAVSCNASELGTDMGLVVLGNGTLALSGSNNYSGGTMILGGSTLQISSLSNLGSSGATITLDGGTLQATGDITLSAPIVLGPDGGTIDSNGFNVVISGQISGGPLAIIDSRTGGNGTLTSTNADNSYTGGTDLESGTLKLGAGANLGSGALVVNGGTLDLGGNSITVASLSGVGGTIINNGAAAAVLTVNQASDITNYAFAGNLEDGSASLGLNYAGSSTLTLGGTNSLSGGVGIGSGSTLVVGDGATLNAAIVNSGTLAFNNSGSLTFAYEITGLGNVIMTGSGTLSFSNTNNNWSGGTIVAGGLVQFDSLASLPASGLVLIENGGALAATGAHSTAADWLTSQVIDPNSDGALALTADESAIDLTNYPLLSIGAVGSVNFDGTITQVGGAFNLGGGPGVLTVATHLTGANSLVINGNVVLNNSSNNYTLGTVINAGTLGIYADANLGSASGEITFAGAGILQALGGFASARSIVTPDDPTLTATVDAAGQAITLTGPLTGNAVLNFIDSTASDGSAILSGADSISGGISVDVSGTVTIVDGGMPAGPIADNGALNFNLSGNGSYSATISATGSVSIIGDGVMKFTGSNSYQGGTYVSSGTLVVTSASGLAAGSALFVGADASDVFSGGSGGNANLSGGRGMAAGNSSGSGSDSDSGSSSDSNSGGGSSHSGMRQLLQEEETAADAVLQAIQTAIDPSNQVHSASVVSRSLTLYVDILWAIVPADLTLSAREAAILQVVELNEITAVPNGDTYTPFSNPAGFGALDDYNAILQFFATHDCD